jgi:PPM family protein phosphatase
MNTLNKALTIARRTDIGQLRSRNEDSIASDASIGLALLADGMGGYNAGDIASQMATLTITAELKNKLSNTQTTEIPLDITILTDYITDAVNMANKAIYQVSLEQPQCSGMGTTLALAMFLDNHVIIAHIGDSRVYQLRGKQLTQITMDHSLIQEHINSGLVDAADAQKSTYKNYITKALGVSTDVAIDINTLKVELNDCYLLCSDGLNDMLSHDEIESTILESASLEQASQQLINKANMAGGKDNISVILIAVEDSFPHKKTRWYNAIFK